MKVFVYEDDDSGKMETSSVTSVFVDVMFKVKSCIVQVLYIYMCVCFFLSQGYSVEQKRAVFFKFVELFHDQNFPQELKAKVCMIVCYL